MGCTIKTKTNTQESILFNTIYNSIGNGDLEQTKKHYTYFESNAEFLKDFATDEQNKPLNWADDFKLPFLNRSINSRRLDENGEPKLEFDNKYGKYFYTNEKNIKVFYPPSKHRLLSTYTNEAIRSISKKLALNFIKDRIGDNFNEFDLAEKKGNLRQSIETKLITKGNELKGSKDFKRRIKGKNLIKSIDNIDEWVDNIENYFREIKLVYKESNETEDLLEEENSERGQTWGVSAFEKSTKDNISSNIKLRLSLLANNILADDAKVDDYFFEPELINFDEVYSDLLKILTDRVVLKGEDLYDTYVNEIKKLTIKKPYLSDLLVTLENIDDYVKAEFVQAFNLHKNDFVGSMYEIKEVELRDSKTHEKTGMGYTVSHSVQNLSNVGAKNRFVKNNWHHNFLNNFTSEQAFNEGSKEMLQNVNKELSSVKPTVDNIAESSTQIRKVLENLGVATSADGFTHYLDNLEANSATLEEKVQKLIKLKSSTHYLLGGILEGKVKVIDKNPFDSQIELNTLSQAESFYLSEGSDASIFTTGKSKWLYSYPSYLSSKVKGWKRNREALVSDYNMSPYTKGSYYMRFLLALDEKIDEEAQIELSTQRIKDFNLVVFNSLQEVGDAANAVDNKGISKNDFYADIYNKMLGFRKSGGVSYINTATPADKGTQYQFALPKDMTISSNARYAGDFISVDDPAVNAVFQHINGEFERIKQVQRELDLAEETGDKSNLRMYKHLNGKKRPNGLNFQSFPELNYGSDFLKNSPIELYDSVGRPLFTTDITIETIKPVIETLIKNTFDKDIRQVVTQLRNIGLINRNQLGDDINKGFDTEIWNFYKDSKHPALKIAADIYINGLISQLEYSKMFAGDTAFYKHMVDYKKRIPATYTDGLQLYLRPGEEFFKASIIEGVEIPTRYMTELEELVGKDIAAKYTKINSTDAQAWITPKRWKFLKERLGKWSAKDDVVYDKLLGKNKEPFTVDELKRAAQPLKGVYFELNSGTPTYLKYSQAVLIPQILENNKELQILADKMKSSKTDELITIDGIKVGANEPTLTHDENGRVLEDFTLTPLNLKNSGWKLQQDLPIKTFKDTEVGSQIQKNIFAGLAFNREETFTLEGKDISGEELLNHINSIIENLSDKGKEKFKKEFGITPDNKIGNIDRLNRALVEELKTRRAPQNVIDALESGLSPFGIPGYQQKLQNIFASITLKRLVKIKTNGGSFIQMANYGFNKDQANNKGVIWTPWAEETTHEPRFLKDENDKFILSESGKKIVRPGGILISGSFIAKYVPDYAKKSTEELFGTKENNYEDGLIDQKILKNIIGYRIPNQGLASNDALEIVGILPEGMGDTVVAYTGITTKTGSDFDIDKMFLMLGSYKPIQHQSTYNDAKKWVKDELGLSKDDLQVELITEGYNAATLGGYNDMLTLFVEDILFNPLSQSPLKEEFEKDILKIISKKGVKRLKYITDNKSLEESSIEGLQNKLIEAYKAVLTHPEVIKDVMTPIDFDFIKDDVVNLHPTPKSTALSDFNLINEVALKYQFSAGKAGVGQTANALVDHVRGMMADLSFNDYRLGLGKVNEKGDTSFDAEYSEELSKEDYEYYAKVTGLDVKVLKKIKVASSLSALMNAYVDIAKDPYITRGNWTTQTANVGFMLLRAGVHPFKVNAIIGQPVIKEYIEFITNAESKINKNTGNSAEKFIEDRVKKILEGKDITVNGVNKTYRAIYEATRGTVTQGRLDTLFKGKVPEATVTEITSEIVNTKNSFVKTDNFRVGELSLEKLRTQITGTATAKMQMNIFHTFIEWQEQSKKVVDNIKASKADTQGYGKNVSSMIIARNLIDKLLHNSNDTGDFKGFDSKLITYGEEVLEEQGEVKEGVSDIFAENKELAEIGSAQQYSNYLETIFPESKLTGLYYHGTTEKFEEFDLTFFGRTDPGDHGEGVYITGKKENTDMYGGIILPLLINVKNPVNVKDMEGKSHLFNRYFKPEAEVRKEGEESISNIIKQTKKNNAKWEKELKNVDNNLNTDIYKFSNEKGGYVTHKGELIGKETIKDQFKINIINVDNDEKRFRKDLENDLKTLTKEATAYLKKYDAVVNEDYELVIPDVKQIHILGSKKDVEGFKDYVGGNQQQTKSVSKKTLLGTYVENDVNFVNDVMQANPLTFLIATPTIVNTFNEISKGSTGDILLDEKLAGKLENGYYSYMMSGFPALQMTEEDRADILDSTVKEISALKKSSDNYLIQELDIKIAEDGTKFIGMNNRKKSPTIENDLSTAWSDLLKESPELAEKLIKYSYLTSGFQMSLNQFYTYIPFEWFAKNNLNDYIQDLAINLNKQSLTTDNTFIKDFAKSNIADYQVVPKVFKSQTSSVYLNNKYGFVLEDEQEGRAWVKKTITKGKDGLYQLIGYTEKNQPIYVAESTLGFSDKKGYKVVEYNMNQDDNKSNFDINNIDITNEIRNTFEKLVVKDIEGNISNSPAADINSEVPVKQPETIKEYANKYTGRFYQTREIKTQEDHNYYKDLVKRLENDTLKYAMFEFFDGTTDLRDKNNFKPYYDKLIELGFRPVEGKEYILSKNGVNPYEEFKKISQPVVEEVEIDINFNLLRQLSKDKKVTINDLKDYSLKNPIENNGTTITTIIPDMTGGNVKIIFKRESGTWMVKLTVKNDILRKELFKDEGKNGEESFISSSKMTQDFMDKSVDATIPQNLLQSIKKDLESVPEQTSGKLNTVDFTYTESIDKKYGIKKTLGDIMKEDNTKKVRKKQVITNPKQTSLFDNQGDPTQMDCQ